jgi:hypothetical protein
VEDIMSGDEREMRRRGPARYHDLVAWPRDGRFPAVDDPKHLIPAADFTVPLICTDRGRHKRRTLAMATRDGYLIAKRLNDREFVTVADPPPCPSCPRAPRPSRQQLAAKIVELDAVGVSTVDLSYLPF